MKLTRIVLYICMLCTCSWALKAQEQDSIPVKKTKVFLEHANTLSFDQDIKPDAQILVGDVCFRHDSSYMYCDSAYFYEKTNSLEAFSNVRMEQGDTLFVYGQYLYYDGNTQIARLRDLVRMENRQVTLFTDSLNYERIPNIGYYFEGGMIVDSLNQLSSFMGNTVQLPNWPSLTTVSDWKTPTSPYTLIHFIIIRNPRFLQFWGLPSLYRIAEQSIHRKDGMTPYMIHPCFLTVLK